MRCLLPPRSRGLGSLLLSRCRRCRAAISSAIILLEVCSNEGLASLVRACHFSFGETCVVGVGWGPRVSQIWLLWLRLPDVLGPIARGWKKPCSRQVYCWGAGEGCSTGCAQSLVQPGSVIPCDRGCLQTDLVRAGLWGSESRLAETGLIRFLGLVERVSFEHPLPWGDTANPVCSLASL